MNLKNYFNIKYALQNLKKSRGTLALFLGIFPIINCLILLLFYADTSVIPSILDMSILNICGLYILPIVISLCLFQFIFKKKSVDFIGSMPISRKSIFITNTITGICLILLMQLINVILILIVGAVTSSIIPFRMLLDYFILWSLSYIFTFVISNVAVSISGNAITSIIVTSILLFIFPFVSDYTVKNIDKYNSSIGILVECKNKECAPDIYSCYNDGDCLEKEKSGIYRVNDVSRGTKNNHPLPYGLFKSLFTSANGLEEFTFYRSKSLIYTIIFSILGFFIGFYSFSHRKLENNETSFKSDRLHALVKGLLIFPIILLSYDEFDDPITLILFLALIIGYYFFYDLITRRRIGKVFSNLKYLVITIVVIVLFGQFLKSMPYKNSKYVLSSRDIESIELKNSSISISDDMYPVIRNKKMINKIIKATLNQRVEGKNYRYYPVVLKTTKNDIFRYSLMISDEDIESLEKDIMKSSDYIEYKNMTSMNFYLYQIGERSSIHRLDSKTEKEFKNILKNYRPDKTTSKATYMDWIKFVAYQDGRQICIELPSFISHEFEKLVVKDISIKNQEAAKLLLEKNDVFEGIEGPSIEKSYPYYYLLRNMNSDIDSFVRKYSKEKFDLYQDYLVLYNYSGTQFVTNRVGEFKKLLEKKHEELKDTKEYQEWLENINYSDPLGEDTYVND